MRIEPRINVFQVGAFCSLLAIPYQPEVEGWGIVAYDKQLAESSLKTHGAVHGCSGVSSPLSIYTDFEQRLKHIAVQHLGSIGAIEALDIGVLGRLAGLGKHKFHSVVCSLLGQRLADQFRAVIQANPAWTRRRNSTLCSQSRMNSVRSMWPNSRSATAKPF